MSTNRDLKLNVRHFVQESRNALRHNESSKVAESLSLMTCLLPAIQRETIPTNLPYTMDQLPEVSVEFMSGHYRQWLELLVDHLNIEWLNQIPRGETAILLDIFFLQGAPADSFSVLINAVSHNSPGFKVNKCVSLLEAFLREHRLGQMMWEQCKVDGAPRSSQVGEKWAPDPYTSQVWDDLVTLVVTLPERVTNKLQKETSPAFYPDQYIPTLVQDLLSTLHRVHDSVKATTDCSLQFLSLLLGKLCLAGYGEQVWSLLMPQVVRLMNVDFVWSRVLERLIAGVPDRTLEVVVTPLVKLAPWYGTLTWLLGNQVVSSHKLQYLLTNKLLLLRHFPQDIVLQNVIGYLAASPARKHLHHKVLKTLLEVWGDASAVKHTSYDQHRYLSRAILVCLAFLQEKDTTDLREGVLNRLMSGVQSHLDSPLPQIRRLGMIVAESVTSKADPTGKHKLEFQYEHDAEVDQLRALLVPPTDPGVPDEPSSKVEDLERIMKNAQLSEKDVGKETRSDEQGSRKTESNGSDTDLDSDDDLEPYDLSNDTKVQKIKPPVYVRDCMEGLLSSEDGDRVEACLIVSENLIRYHPLAVTEVASEFTRILLHLQDNFSIPSFRLLRHSSMIALGVIAPAQVADYLTKEFYERNYNLRQRMDILEVLASAAQELSRPSSGIKGRAETPKIEAIIPESGEPEDWRNIVQRRIASKTRRITRGTTQSAAEQVANRFAPVAGQFFFPLLKNFDRPEATLNLLGDDHVVLGRLLYTLGIIIYAATNANIVRQMGRAMLEFIWIVRYHPEAGVRRAVLFALSMTILAVPGFFLINDLQTEMVEAKTWLENVIQKDVDAECRKLGIQTLVLMENVAKKEFGGDDSGDSSH